MSEYSLTIDYQQVTDGKVDGQNLTTDNSSDLQIHLLKQKVFAKHLTAALDNIAQELCDMGLTATAPAPKPRSRKK